VRLGVIAATAFSLIAPLLAAAPVLAQALPAAALQAPPPLPGFVPPYEITRIVRSAGFDPLAPPLREGTTYVVRATDFRGILMRVVVDAHSGAIRAVNRIVSGPGPSGPIGMLPSPAGLPPAYAPPAYAPPAYAPPAYAPPAYAPPAYRPPDVIDPEMAPDEGSIAPPVPAADLPPAAIRPASHPLMSGLPPLPRPRPAELASRRAADDAKPPGQLSPKPNSTPLGSPAAAKKPPAAAPLPD
jgi:hypothetical protein